MNKLKYFIPAFILMTIIFIFSSQTGNESSGLSSQIVHWIQQNLHINIPELFIRKGAHMSEYALLNLTFIYGFYKNQLTISRICLFSIVCTFLYACTDEFHQLFINGRAGLFSDVLIDTSGGIIALVIFYVIYNKLKKST